MSNRIRWSMVAAASVIALALIAFFTTQASRTAASADATVKIAVIDTEKILTTSVTGKGALASMKKLQETLESEVRMMQQAIKDLQTKIQDGRQSLSQDQLAQLQKQLDDKLTALRRKQDDSTRDLNKKRDEVLGEIDKRVMPVINLIGKEMGYTLVFRKFESGLIYADEATDITALVIQRLDTGASGPPPTRTTPAGAPTGAPTGAFNISAAGNIGIGTASPSHKVHIVGAGVQRLTILETGNNVDVRVVASTTNGFLGTASNHFLNIGTNSSANMTILTNGRVGVGTTAPDQVFSVNGDASKVGGGSWQTFSDERLKNINGRFNRGLSAIMRLQPLRFEYKRDNVLGLKSEGERIGFGAQTLQQVVPEAVTRNGDGYLMVNNDPIIWAMLNAIKEQQKQIAAQESEVRKLRAAARRHRK